VIPFKLLTEIESRWLSEAREGSRGREGWGKVDEKVLSYS
jgi:hypothetical protein